MRLLQGIVLFAILLLTSQLSVAGVNFPFKDINGKKHNLSDFSGKWTIVNYWGVRCAPCRAEVPELNRIHRKYGNKVKIVGIELMSSTNSDIRNFMSTNGMRFTVAGTQRSVIHPKGLGRIASLPTTFIVSPDGRMVKKHTGILTEQHVRPYLTSAAPTQMVQKEEKKPEPKVVEEKKPEPKQVAVVEQKPEQPKRAEPPKPVAQPAAAPQPSEPPKQVAQKAPAPQPAPAPRQQAVQKAAPQPAPAPRQQVAQKPAPKPPAKSQSMHDMMMNIDLTKY